MSRSDEERLADLLEAADECEMVVAEGWEAYDSNFILQRALAKMLEIIGESARAMSSEYRALRPDIPWSDIVDLRVLLVHHYHRADPAQLWDIAVREVPNLVRQLRRPVS